MTKALFHRSVLLCLCADMGLSSFKGEEVRKSDVTVEKNQTR